MDSHANGSHRRQSSGTEPASIEHPLILIEDGKIDSIASRDSPQLPAGARVLDFPGATLAPAFFDVHIHGAAGHDVMEATPEALETIGRFSLPAEQPHISPPPSPRRWTPPSAHSTASPTTSPSCPTPGRARPLGIHLEGPFLSHAKRGVQPAEYLLAPDIATFDRLVDAPKATCA